MGPRHVLRRSLFALSLFLQLPACATQTALNPYEAVDASHVPHELTRTESSNGLPASLQGVWWFAREGTDEQLLLSFQAAQKTSLERNFIWKSSDAGTYALLSNRHEGPVYRKQLPNNAGLKLTLSQDGHELQIKSFMGSNQRIAAWPHVFTHFTATEAEAGHWVAHSKVFGLSAEDYEMKRIMDAKGHPLEPAFGEYMRATGQSYSAALTPQP